MVAVALVLLLGGLLVYNVGRLNLARTHLQNTADSAAYSGAVLVARAYNFAAYSNRAMVANQVAIAQMVSLASWSRYYCLTFTDAECGQFETTGTDELIQTALELIEPGEPGITANEAYQGISQGIFDALDAAIPPIVSGLNVLEGLLSDASYVYYNATLAELDLGAVGEGPLAKVVSDNDPNASISVFGYGTLAASLGELYGFTTQYTPLNNENDATSLDGSNRFHDVTVASLDPWTSSRSGPEMPPFTSELTAVGECLGDGVGFMIETGGWKGSASLDANNKAWRATDSGDFVGAGVCVILVDIVVAVIPVPIPLIIPAPPSNGKASAGDPENEPYDIETYSGVRPYLDVKDLNDPDMSSPTLTLFVQRAAASINTTAQMKARGEAIAGGNLQLQDQESGQQMQVAASANAYFARPDANLTLGGYAVYGNLFNPYWEAHLVPTSDAEIAAADAAQGITP